MTARSLRLGRAAVEACSFWKLIMKKSPETSESRSLNLCEMYHSSPLSALSAVVSEDCKALWATTVEQANRARGPRPCLEFTDLRLGKSVLGHLRPA